MQKKKKKIMSTEKENDGKIVFSVFYRIILYIMYIHTKEQHTQGPTKKKAQTSLEISFLYTYVHTISPAYRSSSYTFFNIQIQDKVSQDRIFF